MSVHEALSTLKKNEPLSAYCLWVSCHMDCYGLVSLWEIFYWRILHDQTTLDHLMWGLFFLLEMIHKKWFFIGLNKVSMCLCISLRSSHLFTSHEEKICFPLTMMTQNAHEWCHLLVLCRRIWRIGPLMCSQMHSPELKKLLDRVPSDSTLMPGVHNDTYCWRV